MAIPSRQIGWSTKANLLWQISKQLERLTCVTAGGCGTTTTTTTIAPTTTTTTTICVEFINSIIISNGSYAPANGTYTRDNPLGAFTNENGSIFFSGDAWYIFNTTIGNVARNTSTLGTGTWEPWAPGNSSGITAEYFYYTCPTTTTTTTLAPLVNTNSTFVDCPGACDAGPCSQPYDYFDVWMTQECIDTFPTVGCVIWLDDKATIPFPNGSYNDGTGLGCIYITNGTITSTPPPVFTDTTFINCPGSCFIGCVVPYNYYSVYMSQACIDSWPTEGCEVWLDANATEPFPTGSYPSLTGCIDIENGIVI